MEAHKCEDVIFECRIDGPCGRVVAVRGKFRHGINAAIRSAVISVRSAARPAAATAKAAAVPAAAASPAASAATAKTAPAPSAKPSAAKLGAGDCRCSPDQRQP